jgi:hypothetical protein
MPKDSPDAIGIAQQAADVTGTGRHGPFTKAQSVAIESRFKEWRDFAFVKHPEVGGRGQSGKLTKWKQDRAAELLEHPAFKVLPNGVGLE